PREPEDTPLEMPFDEWLPELPTLLEEPDGLLGAVLDELAEPAELPAPAGAVVPEPAVPNEPERADVVGAGVPPAGAVLLASLPAAAGWPLGAVLPAPAAGAGAGFPVVAAADPIAAAAAPTAAPAKAPLISPEETEELRP
ncbi:MAG: hypothetical protein K0S39_595, partial [Paenibacillus sp.]|nr:hypothetical protein [Paenibacillus sp.]